MTDALETAAPAGTGNGADGFTLIETVLTIALVSIAFVGILTAVAGMIAAGAANQRLSTAEAAARNASEFLAGQTYVACTPSTDAATAYEADIASDHTGAFPANYHIDIAVNTWDTNSNPATFPGACPGADTGLQAIRITATSTSGLGPAYSKTLTIVKRATS
jgi:prepilin-type N-terminal cleavage/methylation domain-containing protein